jgi:DMSO reductase anchor subunit
MHPAFSVILLTTLLGAGQGLFLALYSGQVYSLANILPAQDGRGFYATGSALALALLATGLAASFFHLGRPERAWRAAARWRTSWLSREAIALPVVLVLVALYAASHWLGGTTPLLAGGLPVDATLILGALATAASVALFVCTGMIYAGLRFLQEWASPLTPVNFTLLGTASGFTLATAFAAHAAPGLVAFYAAWAAALGALALVTRGASLLRNARLHPRSNLQSAIGVRHSQIAQMAQGATGGSFNTREFFHGARPQRLRQVPAVFLVLVFPAPIVLLGATAVLDSAWLPLLAFGLQYLGLLAERWYFFADARHPQNLYYQAVA